jgi:hypothetical protein
MNSANRGWDLFYLLKNFVFQLRGNKKRKRFIVNFWRGNAGDIYKYYPRCRVLSPSARAADAFGHCDQNNFPFYSNYMAGYTKVRTLHS